MFSFLVCFLEFVIVYYKVVLLDNVDGQASFDARFERISNAFLRIKWGLLWTVRRMKTRRGGGEFVRFVILWYHVYVVFVEGWRMSTDGNLLEGCV